jgi:hypothetical protein
MSTATDQTRAEALLHDLSARATGLWRVAGDVLLQRGFAAAVDMPGEVARGFAEATRSVALDLVERGIVKAAVQNAVAVSVAAELPPDVGSGYWLRAFGAERSVAVPLTGPDGVVAAVFSVALAADSRTDAEIAAIVRGWGSASPRHA